MIIVARKMKSQDLAAVDRIQTEVYQAKFRERVEVFAEKLRQFPDGCWIGEADGAAVGYLFSHPSRLDSPPALDKFFGAVSGPSDCYFIHDLAVQPSARKLGIGGRLVDQAFQNAADQGFETVALVSIQNSGEYWRRHGFRPVADLKDAVRSIGETYGEAACYMSRRVAQRRGEPTAAAEG